MANPTVITPDTLDVLRTALGGGASVAEAASTAGIGTVTAYRAIKAHGMPLPGRRAPAPAPTTRPPSRGDRTRAQVLGYVTDQITFTGHPPTQRETAAALGLAPATVAYQMGQLSQRGLLADGENRTRAASLRGRVFWEALDDIEQYSSTLDPSDPYARLLAALCTPFRRPRRTAPNRPADTVRAMVEHLALKHGRPTTEAEVAAATGLPPATVSAALDRLTDGGEVERCSPGLRLRGPNPVARAVFALRRPNALSALPDPVRASTRLVLDVLDAG